MPQNALPLLDGCACLPRLEAAPGQLSVYFDACIDYSRGAEPKPVSVSTVVSITHQQRDVRFHSQLPEVRGTFRYEAGPWPAAYALQVCRDGEPSCGRGFGVSSARSGLIGEVFAEVDALRLIVVSQQAEGGGAVWTQMSTRRSMGNGER